MGRGSILGYDLNEKTCQISYYDEEREEPQTLETSVDNYQIPLARVSVPQKARTEKRLLSYRIFLIKRSTGKKCR